MGTLSAAQLAALCVAHFPAGTVRQTGESIRVTAYAVARAESGGSPAAMGDQGCSIGLWQIDRCIHPQYAASWLLGPDNNAIAAAAISNGGSNWNPWCSWERSACGGNGNLRYRQYLAEARAALAQPAPTPEPVPPAGSAVPWAWLAAGAGGLLLVLAGKRGR